MLSSISIAAPAYNESEGIRLVVEEWERYLSAHFRPENFEIVVCDDGSTDDTGAILDRLARDWPGLHPVRHAVNQGAAAALATAIRATTKQWVLLLDSDGQYPVENLTHLSEAADRQPGAAWIGYRAKKEDSAFARFGSWISGACCNFFYGTHYRDFNCALKLVDGDLLRGLTLEARGLNYSTEISAKILESGVTMQEVAALHRPRVRGRSHRTLWRGSLHRFLFVAYLGLRQLLFKIGVLRRPRLLDL